MLQRPMDVLEQFPIRKTKKQKQAFREAIIAYAQAQGYLCSVERRNLSCQNVVIGDSEKAKYLLTAHYDTCARLPFPNYLTPCSLIGFLLCQLFQVLFIAILAVVLSYLESTVLAGIVAIFNGNLADGWILLAGLIAPSMIWFNVLLVVLLMLFGLANKHNANDNTSGVVTLLEILRTLPENQRDKVCFVLFDLEEAGMIGSSFHRKKHRKASDCQIVLNLDCVGEGDHLRFFPTKALKKDRKKLTALYKACGYFGSKDVLVHEKGFGIYPSDQMQFPYGVGICALKKSKFGLYVGKIHTPKDTVLDMTNVNILRAALTSYICCDAVNVRKEEMK